MRLATWVFNTVFTRIAGLIDNSKRATIQALMSHLFCEIGFQTYWYLGAKHYSVSYILHISDGVSGQFSRGRLIGPSAGGRPTHRIIQGHNRDFRPDLKQLLFILTTTADGVPIFSHVDHGKPATTPRTSARGRACASSPGLRPFGTWASASCVRSRTYRVLPLTADAS